MTIQVIQVTDAAPDVVTVQEESIEQITVVHTAPVEVTVVDS